MKRRIVLFIAGFLYPFIAFGQNSSNDSILIKIHQINSWKTCLDSLSAFDDQELIDSLNHQVTHKLLQILNDKNLVKYRVDTLLHIDVTKSHDNQIKIYSFYENTGGSYQSNMNIIYYLLPNGQPKAKLLTNCNSETGQEESNNNDNDENDYESSNNYGGGIDSIMIIQSNGKKMYLGMGGGISCNTCEFVYAILLSISDSTLNTDFCLSLDYRQGDGKLTYNPTTKILSYDYVVYMDDSLYGSGCSDEEIISDNKCRHKGKYKFNGNTFVEIEKK